jgi:transposase-like protein
MNWVHRFGSLAEAFYIGSAKAAVVDERSVIINGEEAWIWIVLEPRSRRLLGLELSWTRNSLTAYLFLKRLKSLYGIRVIVADGAPWYGVCSELGLRLIHDKDLLNLAERLSKEVKRRLKDFDLYFPCRCRRPFRHVKTWLDAWRGYYNWARYHRSLKASPCNHEGPEPLSILRLIGGDAMS